MERSASDVFQDIIRNLQEIVRSEVRLAKTEIKEEARKAKSASLLIALGGMAATFAAGFLLLTVVWALALIMPNWAAALIVGIVLAAVAGITVSAGLKQFKHVHPTPVRTVETLKENIAWAKQQTK
jgi:uncharacterized membrane protein YqjE